MHGRNTRRKNFGLTAGLDSEYLTIKNHEVQHQI